LQIAEGRRQKAEGRRQEADFESKNAGFRRGMFKTGKPCQGYKLWQG